MCLVVKFSFWKELPSQLVSTKEWFDIVMLVYIFFVYITFTNTLVPENLCTYLFIFFVITFIIIISSIIYFLNNNKISIGSSGRMGSSNFFLF